MTCLVALSVLAGCSAAPIEIERPAPTTTPTTKPAPTAKPTDPVKQPIDNPTQFPDFEEASPETVAALVASQNKVAAELYTRVIRGDDNLAMSPMSISLAFGMVYAGAQDETARQMKEAFQYELPQAAVHQAYGTVLRHWNAKKERPYELAVANRLFGEKTFAFTPMYLGVTGKQYDAELERVDFINTPNPARVHINGWIAEQTNDRIPELLPPKSVTSGTSLVLTNAIYFKGKWKQAFDEKATQDAGFSTPNGKVKTPMMNLTGRHAFAHVDGVKMLQLGYKGDDLAMQLVLPDAVDGLAALEKKLVSGQLDTLAEKLGSEEVIVSLPRFTVAPKEPMKLAEVMKSMGMTDAWDIRQANLKGMADLSDDKRNLFIQEAFHKAFVEVQEEGTVAAAATAIVVGPGRTSVPPPPKRFNANHPFIFVIRDLKTNAILFIGRVNDPRS